MKYTSIAKQLGSRGGKKRAQTLSKERRREIASMGGKARAESILLAKRIRDNFIKVAEMNKLNPPPKVRSVPTFRGKLPSILDKK